MRASREVAGIGASSTGSSSIQFAMLVVNLGRDLAVQPPSRPEDTVLVHGHGWGSGRADRDVCVVHCGEVWQSHP